jgi:hypothetical protein
MRYAESSSFFLFCYEFEGGKYAGALNRFLKRTYEGYTQTEEFKKAFGVDDLGRLNAEWLTYVETVTPPWIKKRLPSPPGSKKD